MRNLIKTFIDTDKIEVDFFYDPDWIGFGVDCGTNSLRGGKKDNFIICIDFLKYTLETEFKKGEI